MVKNIQKNFKLENERSDIETLPYMQGWFTITKVIGNLNIIITYVGIAYMQYIYANVGISHRAILLY